MSHEETVKKIGIEVENMERIIQKIRNHLKEMEE